MREKSEILAALPYRHPFLFVDSIEEITENSIRGSYTFREDSFFYQGHFKDFPVTPGVILTECMAQIGVVCLGIHLTGKSDLKTCKIALSHTDIDFLKPVFPEETVVVFSQKKYFRFHKLSCEVKMYNQKEELVAKGIISGMIKI